MIRPSRGRGRGNRSRGRVRQGWGKVEDSRLLLVHFVKDNKALGGNEILALLDVKMATD